jgi:DMSO/TMAO reductase YedYZ molybdopterin-dependent catalytic subunit
LVVEGMVRHARRFSLTDLRALAVGPVAVPLHCVWGWSRPDAVWEGVRLVVVLDVVGAEGGFVTVHAGSDSYSSCLPMADARRGVLAWGRDGEPLGPEGGGPLRYVGPPDYWAYKGVKWAARLVVADRFVPGFWEAKVADAEGRIPEEVVLP